MIGTKSGKDAPLTGDEIAAPLWKGFSWVFAGMLVYVLSQWGMISVLSKLGNPEVVGIFSLGLAITTPIIVFSGLQLRQIQATDARADYKFGEYMRLRSFTIVLALSTITGVVLIAGYSWETVLIVIAVAASRAFESVSEIFYGFLQKRERMDIVARSMMIKGPATLLAFGAGFYITGSLLWAALAMAVSWAGVVAGYDLRKSLPLLMKERQEGQKFLSNSSERLRRMARLAWLAFPLGIAIGLSTLTVNIPRYFVEYHLDAHAMGIFSAIAYIMIATRPITGALGQSASPRLSRYYTEGQRGAFISLVLKLFLVSAAIGAAGIIVVLIAGQWILSILYTPEYAEYIGLFAIIMVAAAFDYVAILLNFAMTATRRLRSQSILQVGVVAVTVLGCVVLIPQAGLLGAGIAVIMGKLFQTVIAFGIVSHALVALRRTTNISEAEEAKS